MFKIHPVEEREIAESIYPDLKYDEILFVVNEDGKFTGTGICKLNSATLTIVSLVAPYDDARELMFLAMISYGEKRGAERAVCKAVYLKDLCKKHGFNADFSVSLSSFFKPGRSCGE